MVYVILQFLLLIYFILNISIADWSLFSSMLMAVGGLMGIFAIRTIGFSNLSVFPHVKKKAALIMTGPYRIIRHPMYTSLLLGVGAVVISQPEWHLIIAGLFLIMVLVLKLRYEERKLAEAFPEYEAYKKTTYRLIPFIY